MVSRICNSLYPRLPFTGADVEIWTKEAKDKYFNLEQQLIVI